MGKKMKDTLVMNAFMQVYDRERGLSFIQIKALSLRVVILRPLLRTHGAVSNVSRKGNTYLMESFYRT